MITKNELYYYKALVYDVYDGDTFKADVDLGFDIHTKLTFRLYGVDTPELNKAAQKEAGKLARDFARNAILEKEVIIQSFKPQGSKDKYGRYLAKVFYTDETGQQFDLTVVLIQENLGVPYYGGAKEES